MKNNKTILHLYNELVSLEMENTPKYRQALSEFVDVRDELDKSLNEEEKKKLDKLDDLYHKMGCEEDKQNFIEGFSIAVKLITEAIYKN